jgi:hypothetical protein
MSATATAFALALPSPRPGRLDYLRAGAFLGNLMRTDDPFSARTWPSMAELKLWLDGLPEGAKAQLSGRPLLIVPLELAAGTPRETITLRLLDGPRPAEGEREPPRRTLDTSKVLFGDPAR